MSFIAESNKKHNDKYDYSLVEYKSYDKKVNIICPKHGIFQQIPGKHMRGQGCLKCFHEKESSDDKEFIKESRVVHGDEFDYSLK